MENQKHRISSPVNIALIEPGKSRRLQEIQENARLVKSVSLLEQQVENPGFVTKQGGQLPPELVLVRQLIDQRLDEILNSLPLGKQKRLFKIRFGIDVDLIRELPIKRVLSLIKIQPSVLNNPLVNMKLLGDMNYNGEPVS